jgi:hypothetical protein
MTEPEELTKEEFIEKLKSFDGTGSLTENLRNDRFELRIDNPAGQEVYISPRSSEMVVKDFMEFVRIVDQVSYSKMPRLSRYQW